MSRPRTSLDHVQGRDFASDAEIRAMAAKALKLGVIVFLQADLKQLPWSSRELIETEAKRLYGRSSPMKRRPLKWRYRIMAKAKKRRAKKRRAVAKSERIPATPETLAKLKPDQLERLLRRGPADGGIDDQQFEALWSIKEAADVLGRGLGYQAVDLERVGHGHGDIGTRDARLWDIYVAWSGAFLRATLTNPRVVCEWVNGDRPILDTDVPLLRHAAESWEKCSEEHDRQRKAKGEA